jgi:hypothetical protein
VGVVGVEGGGVSVREGCGCRCVCEGTEWGSGREGGWGGREISVFGVVVKGGGMNLCARCVCVCPCQMCNGPRFM